MNSVDRILKYSSLEGEMDEGESANLPTDWPQYGLITAENSSYAYHSSLPYVLKRLYFCIRSKEKVSKFYYIREPWNGLNLNLPFIDANVVCL